MADGLCHHRPALLRNIDVTGPETILNGAPLLSNSLDGHFVSMTGNHLVMTDSAGQRQALTLDRKAKLTCDGLDCNAEDVPAGSKIRVTTKPDFQKVALRIESLDQRSSFETRTG